MKLCSLDARSEEQRRAPFHGGYGKKIAQWAAFGARATRGLRKMREERPGALFARRTRTMKLCSSDARSKGQPRPLL
jgi:hypothetical protein